MDIRGSDGVVTLPSIGRALSLHDIYERVGFSERSAELPIPRG